MTSEKHEVGEKIHCPEIMWNIARGKKQMIVQVNKKYCK